MATAALPRRPLASSVPISSSRASTVASSRLTKNEATEWRPATSVPTSTARSRPSSQALSTARYRSREKISVTLTLMPSASTVVIAGSPSTVAGILINRLGRSTVAQRARACSTVAAVSCASRGSTSRLTRPSTPSVAS